MYFAPTDKQLTFVSVYFRTGHVATAYEAAGYFDVSKQRPSNRSRAYWRVMQSTGVQRLFQVVMCTWVQKHGITKQWMADKLLNIIDTADNVKDQLDAIQELNSILGYHKSLRLRKKKTPGSQSGIPGKAAA